MSTPTAGQQLAATVHDGSPYCIGHHDADGECVEASPCDPRCLGHHGKPVPCTPCPQSRCVEHDTAGCADLCQRIYCTGHEMDDDEDLCCIIAKHAPWCPPACRAHGTDGEHELDLGNDVVIYSELLEPSTYMCVSLDDSAHDVADADALIAKTEAILAAMRTARMILAVEAASAAALQLP